ncbi:succinate dehydrogenase cytochrome b560 subunit, mitochondrial-like [Pectinophora gossypiella]|uniref:succinate dehydrogenase cytochrome b560 subunit, mitochondrial-like n=1 Tax=Pectinophora gossypiella TaxID=13191 RepID=UPI00214E2040|nr:succinate dehydrogenase cytochrome b560 subunit, mitochondrial-like [Pectinophora gossypiella]
MVLPHDAKNMKLKRPMSPHLTVYGPTLPAMTSILQRITGTMVTMYALGMASVALFVPKGVTGLVEYIQSWDFPSVLIIGVKTIIASSFAFHYLFGIRFTGFNLGKFLEMKTAYSTAYVCIALSIVGGVAGGLIGHVYSFM